MTIARNGSADLGGNGGAAGSWTVAYTVNASSNFLVFSVGGGYGAGANDIVGVTYNGASMTVAGVTSGTTSPNITRSQYFFFLFNPTTGSNNFVVSKGGSAGGDTLVLGVAADYGGVATAQLDSAPQTFTSSGAAVTTLADNVYAVNTGAWCISGVGAATVNSLTNNHMTQVVVGVANTFPFIFDSNTTISPGLFSNTYSFTSGPITATTLTIAPTGTTFLTGPTSYFVDNNTGSDSNNGTSISTPWASIARVNSVVFNGGDIVSFEGGETFSGSISVGAGNWGTNPTPSGTAPVTFTSYGAGRATISPSSSTVNGFNSLNIGAIVLNNLNWLGASQTSGQNQGIQISATSGATLNFIQVTNCDVNTFSYGGVFIQAFVGSVFTNVTVQNCTIHDGGGSANAFSTALVLTSCNSHLIANCTIYNWIGTSGTGNYTGAGVTTNSCVNGTNQFNLIHDLGVNATPRSATGIFDVAGSANVTQFNEIYNVFGVSGGTDGDGICSAGGTNNVFQYNWVHDCGGAGICIFLNPGFPEVGTTIRYNITQNNGNASTGTTYGELDIACLSATSVTGIAVYNNTCYSNKTSTGHILGISPSTNATGITGRICNNLFYSAGTGVGLIVYASLSGSTSNLHLDGNEYFAAGTFSIQWNGTNYSTLSAWKTATGQESVNGGLTSSPGLVNAGGAGTTGGYVPASMTAYTLVSGSPMIAAGINLNSQFSINPGTQDFFGDPIPNSYGKYDVGAYNFTPRTTRHWMLRVNI